MKADGAEVRLDYLPWPQRLRADFVRPAAVALRYTGGRFEERFGHVDEPKALVESWLAAPWPRAVEATLPASARALEAVHARLTARAIPSESSYSAELFPAAGGRRRLAVYCARAEKRRCPEWPKTVDFELARYEGRWLVAGVEER